MKFLSPALTFCARRWRRQSVVSFNTVSPQASSSSTTGFQPKSLDEINELLNEVAIFFLAGQIDTDGFDGRVTINHYVVVRE